MDVLLTNVAYDIAIGAVPAINKHVRKFDSLANNLKLFLENFQSSYFHKKNILKEPLKVIS